MTSILRASEQRRELVAREFCAIERLMTGVIRLTPKTLLRRAGAFNTGAPDRMDMLIHHDIAAVAYEIDLS